jgi:AhpD family alkylhydroperoxidase
MIPQQVQQAIMRQVHGVRPVARHAAQGLVAAIYAQIEQDFGAIVAPFSLHSPDPQVLASNWAITRETLVVPGSVPRRAKEAVAAAVSKANECPFCVDVHTTVLDAFAEHDLAEAILTGQISQAPDPQIRLFLII